MSVETINGYVLLAEPADWSDQPKWTLKWDTEVAGTLRGNEGRSALREMPRPALQYKVQPLRTERQARLAAALTVGLASGKCCAPTWGRASWLAADAAVGATTIVIEPSAWAWTVNDWLLIYTASGAHQTAQITAIDAAGTTFTLAALTASCGAESAVHPLFFGRPEVTDIEQTNGSISNAMITLTGDEFVISADVPTACLVVGPAFDFAVVRFLKLTADANSYLETNTALVLPALENAVGEFGQGQVPAAGDFYTVFGGPPPAASQSEQPYLLYGGNPGAGPGAPLVQSVLINFGRLAVDYPAAHTIKVELRAYWGVAAPADGHVTLQYTTYQGGTMQGGNFHGDSRGTAPADFTSTGGSVVTQIAATLLVNTVAAYGSAGQVCGTLVYTPATRTTVLLPP